MEVDGGEGGGDDDGGSGMLNWGGEVGGDIVGDGGEKGEGLGVVVPGLG